MEETNEKVKEYDVDIRGPSRCKAYLSRKTIFLEHLSASRLDSLILQNIITLDRTQIGTIFSPEMVIFLTDHKVTR